MHVAQDSAITSVRTFYYALEVTLERFCLVDPRTGHTLIDCPASLMYCPEFYPNQEGWVADKVGVQGSDAGPLKIAIYGHGLQDSQLTITLICFEDYVELTASTGPLPRSASVAYWNLFAPNTTVDMFHVHHWRNRHGHDKTYETYNLTQGDRYNEEFPDTLLPEMRDQWTKLTEFTTYSTDWQFAPRPSFFLLQRDSVMIGIGARDLPHGFGLEMRSASTKLHYLRFNYGGEHGYPIAAGKSAIAPRVYLWLGHSGSIWDGVDQYVRLLEQDGMAKRRSNQDAPHWWTKPQYCTWQDQGYISGEGSFYNWMGDKPKGLGPVNSFDSDMLDYLIDQIQRERLNVGSVIIDDGWQRARGEWVAHPKRFPQLRKQIDRIHAAGMKAVLWIAPMDFDEGAAVLNRPELLCGAGTLNRFGSPLVDYSNPKAQDEYVRPMMRYFFSDEPDCLDADGIKTDFMAEKVQAYLPVHDLEWRGEEPFLFNTLQLFYREMRAYKPDGMHLGAVAHPFFTQVQDVIRTFDVPSSQLQHEDRAIMLRYFAPGNLVSLDLGECRSLADIEQHLDIAYKNNLLYELPRIAANATTGEHPLGPDYYPLLRRKLAAWG